MKVCFDYQIFWLQVQGGISRYFCELAAHLHQIGDCDPKIAAPFHGNDNLRAIAHKPYVNVLNPVVRKMFYNRLWNRKTQLNEQAAMWHLRGKKSVLHETYYTHRFSTGRPTVTTVHDMIYEKFHQGLPDELEVIAAKKKAMQEADAVIAVSHNTASDIVDLYPELKAKISVVHHGVRLPAAVKKLPPGRPFLLYVGNRGWYKNFLLLLEVYASSSEISETLDLCCFGGEAPTEKEKETISRFGLVEKVRFLRGDDQLLAALYAEAAVLVYNSAYEGFGMPVLEAMLSSCPVICSSTSSLPEVAGGAAVTVEPGDAQELAGALKRVLFGGERESLISGGLRQAARFTWEKCAQETLRVYQQLI